jgi:hypothetical protein
MKKMLHCTHICDVKIPSLPHVLKGHINPALNVASLLGIQILCKVEFQVVFTDTTCYIKYNEKIILRGTKDPSTDLSGELGYGLTGFNEGRKV